MALFLSRPSPCLPVMQTPFGRAPVQNVFLDKQRKFLSVQVGSVLLAFSAKTAGWCTCIDLLFGFVSLQALGMRL